jgi:predicted O-methyltransferase YrrM
VLAVSPNACGGEERHATDAARQEFLANFPRSFINTTPEDAMLLRILVEARNAQRGIEVGSANGYGALNMGIGFERTGGHLFTIDIDPRMVRECRENVRKMALEKTVTVVEGDALEVLTKMEGQFDFLFIDALKSDYLKYLELIEPRLKPGAVVVADNTIRYAGAMRDFLDYVAQSPDYEHVTLRASDAKRDGLTVIYKIR